MSPTPSRNAPDSIEIDPRRIASVLSVLASANRIDLLRQLQEPKCASEIHLMPEDVREGENPERSLSVQAVRLHLARLASIGVVSVRKGLRPSGPVDEYVINQQRLFAIAEDFRLLGALKPTLQMGGEPTISASLPRHDTPTAGARLILVHGLNEGRPFLLRLTDLAAERGWVIGRRQGLSVSLDYDPFASSENSEITWKDGSYVLHDIRSSRNGTTLNWERLPKGGSRTLTPGDIIGVGHSLLLFRRD